ncbi:hypothetical protein PN499_21895 [Kamptonema animale CS-326]|nr:hypothetical protein [Kamptonema animale]MDB9513855.1 hypothetical protein [Kamptonema animale CS-326]
MILRSQISDTFSVEVVAAGCDRYTDRYRRYVCKLVGEAFRGRQL